MGRELYVRHLSVKGTEEEVVKLFSLCGRVTSVHFEERESGKGGRETRSCFVRMGSDAEAAEARVTLDGALFHGRRIFVDFARSQKQLSGGKRPLRGAKRQRG